MSLVSGGGEYGGAGEASTHTKPPARNAIVLARKERQVVIEEVPEEDDSNWDRAEEDGTNVGPEVRITGEVDLDDDICVDEPDEEEGTPVAGEIKVWRLLARYYSIKTVLDSIQIWVRFYDVPWNKQTKAYGRFVGGHLRRVEEVDVDKAGLEFNDYLRVRIVLPLNKRLQTRFTTNIKGQVSPMVYPLSYERIPHFHFHCGFIGHAKEECEKKIRGLSSLCYDSLLRCSPKHKFERRSVSTYAKPAAKKNLFFSSPTGSVGSSPLGMPNNSQEAYMAKPQAYSVEVLDAVDARADFEKKEFKTTEDVEQALANMVD
ncbi:unnamed protein product [Alopecurus aequalis]